LTSAHLQYRAIRERERLLAEQDEAERRRLTEMALRKTGFASSNVSEEVMTSSSKV
jgi:hypothetical protein